MPKKTKQNSTWSDRIAAFWGFAEATFFFIIPDLFIAFRSMTGVRRGLRAASLALAGALVGGVVMYAFGAYSPGDAMNFVDRIPTVTDTSIQKASRDLETFGAWALFLGPWQFLAYKIFAVLAPTYHIPFWQFLLISIPARMIRFATVAIIVAGVVQLTRPVLNRRKQWLLFAVIWTAIYITFFSNHWI